MRRSILLASILLIILGSLSTLIIFRMIRNARRLPTHLGWRARVTTLAGDGSPGDASQRAQAAFADPFGIAITDDGVIYVADAGDSNRIRKLAPDGSVTTLAGTVEAFADGSGSQAAFNTPSGLAILAIRFSNRTARLLPASNSPASTSCSDAFPRTGTQQRLPTRNRAGSQSMAARPPGSSTT